MRARERVTRLDSKQPPDPVAVCLRAPNPGRGATSTSGCWPDCGSFGPTVKTRHVRIPTARGHGCPGRRRDLHGAARTPLVIRRALSRHALRDAPSLVCVARAFIPRLAPWTLEPLGADPHAGWCRRSLEDQPPCRSARSGLARLASRATSPPRACRRACGSTLRPSRSVLHAGTCAAPRARLRDRPSSRTRGRARDTPRRTPGSTRVPAGN